SSALDVLASLKTIDTQLAPIKSGLAQTQKEVAGIQTSVASQSATISSQAQQLASTSAQLVATKSDLDFLKLKLSSPESLFATGSASLAKLDVNDTLSTLNLNANTATISATLKSLGNTILANTLIAGDLTVDGTFSITNGNAVNAIPTLYLQNNSLATLVDIFSGKVTIESNGLISIEKLALGSSTLGSGTILTGQTEVTISTSQVTAKSKVFLTPTSNILGSLILGSQSPDSGFTVKLSQLNSNDVTFNWAIIDQR
ncbi:hypothetical protein HY389_00410, partial [Candidatus Daviesbacteria bacterium]|nr:hypothetical protein [Candidatus Daviesbacteria bacterium]